jgi:hypothetical protein
MGVVLILFGLGAFCVLLFYVAVYVLPFAVGLQVAHWAINTGSGVIGGIAIGLVAGAMVYAIGQAVFASSRSLVIRWIVILLFAIPAAIAGYSTVEQFSDVMGLVPFPIWRQVFAVVGALAVGGTAIARLSAPMPEPRPTFRPTGPQRPQPTGLQKSVLVPE